MIKNRVTNAEGRADVPLGVVLSVSGVENSSPASKTTPREVHPGKKDQIENLRSSNYLPFTSKFWWKWPNRGGRYFVLFDFSRSFGEPLTKKIKETRGLAIRTGFPSFRNFSFRFFEKNRKRWRKKETFAEKRNTKRETLPAPENPIKTQNKH